MQKHGYHRGWEASVSEFYGVFLGWDDRMSMKWLSFERIVIRASGRLGWWLLRV